MAVDPFAPQGPVPAIGIPNSQDYPRLVYTSPYFDTVPIAELIEPAAIEAIEAALPSLVAPYVDQAAQAAVQQSAVLLTGSTMSGPLNLSPLLPTADSMAATKAYVDTMLSTAGVPEVPAVPVGQSWARQVGQWVPLSTNTGGPFLALSGGVMQGQINMSGNAITNMAAIPVMPNGAAPATWVLNQIAAQSLYQGVWNLDTMTPDLTNPATQINSYTWIAITAAPAGVVVGPAVPGLQGQTVHNGDTVIYSATEGRFDAITAGGLTAPEADARYLMLAGGQLSGALLLNANATQNTQAVTLQQLNAFVPAGMLGEAPTTGQLYGRNGLTHAWAAVLPLAGGVLSGALTLSGNATANLQPVTLQQQTASIATAVSGYVPLAGGVTMTGLLTLSGNAGGNLNPVPLQQLNAMLGTYAALANPVFTGDPRAPTPATADNDTSIATTAYVKAQGYAVGNFLPLAGGTISGPLSVTGLTTLSNAVGVTPGTVSNDTSIATTAFVKSLGYVTGGPFAPLNSPVFSGAPSLPAGTTGVTQAAATSNTSLATTAYVKSQGYVTGGPYLPLTGGVLSGAVTANGGIASAGADAALYLVDRTTSANWVAYAQAGVYHLNILAGDVLIIDGATRGVQLPGALSAFSYLMGGNNFAYQNGNFHVVLSQGGSNEAIALGNASDPANYYRNSAHTFQNRNGSALARINAANIVLNGPSGISYSGVNGGSANYIGFGFATVISGKVTVSVDDGALKYALADAASDARMKTDIAPSSYNGLAAIQAIPLHEFRWLDIADPGNLADAAARADAPLVPVGMVAQEVHKIFPEAVVAGDETTEALGQIWQLDYGVLLAAMVGAVQQLAARVEALEA